MTSSRSYKKALPAEQARYELTRNSGTQFDPEVVRAFLGVSVGRLHLIAGPFAWLSQIPLLAPATTAVSAAGTTVVASLAAAVGLFAFQVPSDAAPTSSAPEQIAAAGVARVGESSDAGGSRTAGLTESPSTSVARDRDGNPIVTSAGGAAATGNPGGNDPTSTTRPGTPSTMVTGSSTSTTLSNTTTRAGSNPTAPSTTIGGDGGGGGGPTTTATTTTPTTTTTTTTTTIPNAPPTLTNDSILIVLKGPTLIDVLSNDGDSDGTVVASTLSIVMQPSIGSASVVGGKIRYVAPPLTINTTTLPYQVCDDDGACAQATLTITLAATLL